MNAFEPEGVNKYSTEHFFNQWGGSASLHSMQAVNILFFVFGASRRELLVELQMHVCLVCLNWRTNHVKMLLSMFYTRCLSDLSTPSEKRPRLYDKAKS